MPTIDLFNRAKEEVQIAEALKNDPKSLDKGVLMKYALKSAAQGIVLGAVVGLAITGALAIVAEALEDHNEDPE